MSFNDRGSKNVIIYNESGATIGDVTTPIRIDPTGTTNQPVTAPTLTKGVQGASGWTVQELKDAGRTIKSYVATATAGSTSEALLTLTQYTNFTSGGTSTSFTVTSGKILRLTNMIVTWRNNTAAAGGVTIRFRTNASGAAIVSSPVQFAINATSTAATVGSGTTNNVVFPDGLELSGTIQFALTQIAVGAVVGLDVSVIGYEY